MTKTETPQPFEGVDDSTLLALYDHSSKLVPGFLGSAFDGAARRERADAWKVIQDATARIHAEMVRRGLTTEEV